MTTELFNEETKNKKKKKLLSEIRLNKSIKYTIEHVLTFQLKFNVCSTREVRTDLSIPALEP